MRRLRSLLKLPAAEQGRAVWAVALLTLVRVVLPWMPFQRVRSMLRAEPLSRLFIPASDAAAVRRAVLRAARTVPGSACLAQALVAEHLLRSAGHAADLHIGVRRDDSTTLLAHAWVTSEGHVVAGDDDEPPYAPMLILRR
jgi:hypothetical protein